MCQHTPVPRLSPSLPRAAGCGPLDAFSLLELLVVIAVLGLLSSLLLPSLSRAREFARSTACLRHLQTWGTAFHLYATEHGDCLPPEGAPNPTDRHTNQGWYIQLPVELGIARYQDQPWRTNPLAPAGTPASSPWLCPANPRRSNGRNLFHYCLNQHLDGTGAEDLPVRLSDLPSPARLVTLFDSKNLPAVGHARFTHTNLHSGGARFLFLDGHVRLLKAGAYWNSSLNAPITNTGALLWSP